MNAVATGAGDAAALISGPRARGALYYWAATVSPDVHDIGGRLAFDFEDRTGGTAFMLMCATEEAHTPPPEPAPATVPQLARALAAALDCDVTHAALFHALQQTVNDAMYWQPPHGVDRMLARPELRPALENVAAHVLASPAAHWWSQTMTHPQYQVWWEETDPAHRLPVDDNPTPAELLSTHARDAARIEKQLARHYRWHPRRHISGAWWSTPPHQLLQTSSWIQVPGSARQSDSPDAQALPARRGPSGLYLVEDSMGYELARVGQVPVADTARIYEIATPNDFTALVAQYPREVTWTQRADWGHTTGRQGRWLAVDWQRAAQDWDGIHLTVSAYLAGATRALPVHDDAATVIAGWAPNATWWLTQVAAAQPLAQDPPPQGTQWLTVEY